ncbi:MAG: hypothetical protein DI623_07335 [Sphingomonas sanxanigenens]|uniref:Lipoprotein n=1 Tax=Sphingomonas sanxanigenens TaxID=397260 RepID=A0A2W5A6Z2_9SPHN|nr:MAG: hypothetical protein DI623_07335 [Sphingomonas sanxanigenens]
MPRPRSLHIACVVAFSLMLAGCGGHQDGGGNAGVAAQASAPLPEANAASALPNIVETAEAPTPAGPLACSAEIGKAAARKRADLCVQVSPATHPPCNVANSCAMIEDEIARSCALIGDGSDRPAGCGPAAASIAAASDVIQLYYRALAARDYGTAYAQWSNGGAASGKSYDAFAKGFAETRTTSVTLGQPGAAEGAAGSSFVTIPVTVAATLGDGERQRFAGSYTLRRVNDVPGATPDQLRWRIQSASLRPAR